MINTRSFAPLLALGAMTALGGCSMFGHNNGSAGEYSQMAPAAEPATAPEAPPMAEQQPPPAPAEAPQRTAENSAWAHVPSPVSRHMIRRVQAQLRHDGMYHGHIDGVWGPRSTEAMRDFQGSHHLHRNGQIDLPTLAAMNLPRGDHEQYGQNMRRYGHANTAPNRDLNASNPPNMQHRNGMSGTNTGMNGGGTGANGAQTGANYSTGPQAMPGSANANNLPPSQVHHNDMTNGVTPPPAEQTAPPQSNQGTTPSTH